MTHSREAILLSPEGDSVQWTRLDKGDVSDSSVRDGKEAVGPLPACISRSKKVDWIDTLAAAYAGASDFTRAIGFEEQPLTHRQTQAEPEQKEMRDRILLFERSSPSGKSVS